MAKKQQQSDANDARVEAELEHLDTLFPLAQALTLDPKETASLLEAAYTQARNSPQKGRLELIQTMLRAHASRVSAAESVGDTSPQPRSQQYQEHLAEPILTFTIPAVFATLTPQERVILSLCDIEGLSCSDAAHVMGWDVPTACNFLERTRLVLTEKVKANLPPVYRTLAAQSLADQVQHQLGAIFRDAFGPIPPTLAPSLMASLEPKEASPSTPFQRLHSTPKRGRNRRFQRILASLTLITLAGFLGYLGSSYFNRPPEVNLINLAVDEARRAEVTLATSQSDEAERFLQRRLDWRLDVPQINQADLEGVGTTEVAADVHIPVMIFEDQETPGEVIVIFAASYALLDRHADRVKLENGVLQAIANENVFNLFDLSDTKKVLVWRDADDIFLAVTSNNAAALRDRIVRES